MTEYAIVVAGQLFSTYAGMFFLRLLLLFPIRKRGFGPMDDRFDDLIVQWSNGRSNGSMVGPIILGLFNGPTLCPILGPMVEWWVQWSKGQSSGPIVGAMVRPMVQLSVQ